MCALAIASIAVSACNVNRTLASDGDAATIIEASTSAPGGSDTTATPTTPVTSATTLPPTTGESSTTAAVATTANSTTDTPPPDSSTSEAATTSTTTGEPSLFGKCGWVLRNKYYACDVDGGTPGLVDPDGISPIDCADGLVEGDPCDDRNGPVNGVGCCTSTGVLFFCDTFGRGIIFRQDCGA